MQIVIRVIAKGNDFRTKGRYAAEMLRGMRLLNDTLDSQIIDNKNYAIGSGSILSRGGRPFITYEIKP